jgi:hypothetical protein
MGRNRIEIGYGWKQWSRGSDAFPGRVLDLLLLSWTSIQQADEEGTRVCRPLKGVK